MRKILPKRYVITQARVNWLTLLAFAISFSIAFVLDSWDDKSLREDARNELHEELLDIESALQYRLRRRVEMTAALAGYIQSQPNLTQEQFELLAANIAKLSRGLAGIQLERNAEISHVYPSTIYSSLTGKTVNEIYETNEHGELSPKSPPMPHQDPPGILAYRSPIRLNLLDDNGVEFEEDWGYVIYLLDVEEIIESTGLLGKDAAVDLALTFTPDNNEAKVIFGDPEVLQQDPVSVHLGLPGGEWELAGIDPGWLKIIATHHLHRRLVLGTSVLFFTLWSFSMLSRLRTRGLISDVEAARVESERQFAFLSRVVSVDPIGIYDQQGNIIEFNEAATKMLGYTREELKKLTVFDIDCGLGHERVALGLKNLTPGMISALRTRHRRKDGSECPVEVRLGVVETGEGLRVICAVRDISAQMRYEEELEKLNQDKDQFFTIIAHDLKGPLSGFMGLTQLLAQDAESFSKEDLKVLGEEMYKSGKNLFTLLEELLDWSSLQMGRIEPTPQPFSIAKVIDENLSLLGINARAKNISLISDCPADWIVSADLDMINTVLRNLISNAVKFTHPEGKVCIQAQLTEGRLLVSIQDNGVGMTPDQVSNIFRPGQAQRTQGTAEEKGTGMGLLLCHELLKRTGSELHVESQLGKGSTFSFTLPLARETIFNPS